MHRKMGENVAEGTKGPPKAEHTSKYSLRLYVAGHSSSATLALRNLTRFCETWLKGRYELRVIDVLKEPQAAVADSIVATPTLLRDQPAPVVRVFGTFADAEELAAQLGIEHAAKDAPTDTRAPHARAR